MTMTSFIPYVISETTPPQSHPSFNTADSLRMYHRQQVSDQKTLESLAAEGSPQKVRDISFFVYDDETPTIAYATKVEGRRVIAAAKHFREGARHLSRVYNISREDAEGLFLDHEMVHHALGHLDRKPSAVIAELQVWNALVNHYLRMIGSSKNKKEKMAYAHMADYSHRRAFEHEVVQDALAAGYVSSEDMEAVLSGTEDKGVKARYAKGIAAFASDHQGSISAKKAASETKMKRKAMKALESSEESDPSEEGSDNEGSEGSSEPAQKAA